MWINKHEIDWKSLPWATTSNKTLAAELGVPVSTVGYHRRDLGQPSYRDPRNKIDWAEQPLGKMPDKQLATQLGLHEATVAQQRSCRGIPVFRHPAAKKEK